MQHNQQPGYKRILLLNPAYAGSRVRVVFSSGLGYIAQALKDNRLEYDVLDMSLGYNYRNLKSKVSAFQPDLIGVSMMSYGYKHTYQLIKSVKRDFPEVDIVAGGPHVSLFREEVLKECSQIDFAVVLEGEQTLVELCKTRQPESIKGLI